MPNPTKTKLPKGRVQEFHFNTEKYPCGGEMLLCAVLSCHTRKQARALVKWHGKTREEKKFPIKNILNDLVLGLITSGTFTEDILNLTEGQP
jgi:hypothetical protein